MSFKIQLFSARSLRQSINLKNVLWGFKGTLTKEFVKAYFLLSVGLSRKKQEKFIHIAMNENHHGNSQWIVEFDDLNNKF